MTGPTVDDAARTGGPRDGGSVRPLHVIAVVVLVATAGCGLGGSGTPSPTTVPPGQAVSHPVELATTNTLDYALEVTIEHEGETVYRENLTLDGTAEHRSLTELEESGEYRVRVESNFTAKTGGTAGADRTIYVGEGGRSTVVVNPGNVSVVQQPRPAVETEIPLRLTARTDVSGPLSIEIRRDGETVYDEDIDVEKLSIEEQQQGESELVRTFERSGTYQVIVKSPDSMWHANATAVLRPRVDERDLSIGITVEVDSSVDIHIPSAARRDKPWDP